ncbi:MAG: hypothetical protein ACI8XZ_004614, partial [Gammaproteobacteria bacterium]
MDQIAKNASAVGMNNSRLKRIRPVLQRYVDEGGYGGFVTRVVRGGQLVYADQIGWQDREADVAMSD